MQRDGQIQGRRGGPCRRRRGGGVGVVPLLVPAGELLLIVAAGSLLASSYETNADPRRLYGDGTGRPAGPGFARPAAPGQPATPPPAPFTYTAGYNVTGGRGASGWFGADYERTLLQLSHPRHRPRGRPVVRLSLTRRHQEVQRSRHSHSQAPQSM